MVRLARQFGVEQRARLAPVSFDCARGAPENAGRLFNRQTAEVPQLDDARERLVELREPFEGSVERDDLFGALHHRKLDVFSANESYRASALVGGAPTRVVDGELAHGFGGERKEMMTIVDLKLRVLRELQIHLVYEDGRLQRFVRAVPQSTPREGAKLVVHERHQAADGLSIAIAPCGQQSSDRGRCCGHLLHYDRILRRPHAA
jgi:hypothetical protein